MNIRKTLRKRCGSGAIPQWSPRNCGRRARTMASRSTTSPGSAMYTCELLPGGDMYLRSLHCHCRKRLEEQGGFGELQVSIAAASCSLGYRSVAVRCCESWLCRAESATQSVYDL